MSPFTEDEQQDRDELFDILFRFREAYDEFDQIPSADNVSELSSWTQAVYTRCDEIEESHGTRTASRIIQSAWWGIKVELDEE